MRRFYKSRSPHRKRESTKIELLGDFIPLNSEYVSSTQECEPVDYRKNDRKSPNRTSSSRSLDKRRDDDNLRREGRNSRERSNRNNRSKSPERRHWHSFPQTHSRQRSRSVEKHYSPSPMRNCSSFNDNTRTHSRNQSPIRAPHSPNRHSQSFTDNERLSQDHSSGRSSERNRSSVFHRLKQRSPDIGGRARFSTFSFGAGAVINEVSAAAYGFNQPLNSSREMMNNEAERINIVVRNDSYLGSGARSDYSRTSEEMTQYDIINAVRVLEERQKEALIHCHGLKVTVDQYQREILKLESIVINISREICKLKALLSSN